MLDKAKEEEEEMSYEKRRALDHTTKFSKLDPSDSRKLVEDLLEIVDNRIAVKIADILPRSREEITAIYARERSDISAEEVDKILEIVSKYY